MTKKSGIYTNSWAVPAGRVTVSRPIKFRPISFLLSTRTSFRSTIYQPRGLTNQPVQINKSAGLVLIVHSRRAPGP